jgi:hypothetical protein
VLFLHEVHHVRGAYEGDFEAAYREGWMAQLAREDDARLLWYFNHAHGSGPAYHMVTITGIRDGAAWERLATRVQKGDLRGWTADVDKLRHDVTGKLLLPVPWSPMQELDLAGVPTDGRTHELTIYMEDTGWPHAPLDDYIEFWGRVYWPMLRDQPPERRLLEIQASFQVALGTHRRREAILLQKVHSHQALLHLLTHETPEFYRQPGQFMHDALAFRDQWESKLLRTTAWSPLY